MNYQIKAFQFSVGIHVLIFTIFMNIGFIVPTNKYIVIDFGIEDSMNITQNPLSETGKHQAITKRVTDIKPLEAVQKLETHQENEKTFNEIPVAAPSISETQATIMAPKEQKLVIPKIEDEFNKDISQQGLSTASLIKTDLNSDVNSSYSFEEKNRYLKANFSYIHDMIQKMITYPRIARQMGWEGKVIVSFIVCADGYAKDIKIKEGSGIELLDKDAIETVKKASPFPKPPVEALLLMPIKYSLN